MGMEMDMTHVHECCNMNVVTLRKQVMIVWVGFILLRLFIKGTLSLEQIRTKRLELLRNYFHSCLRGDCLPISTCSLYSLLKIFLFLKKFYKNIKINKNK